MTKAKLAAKLLRRKRTERAHNKAQAGKRIYSQGKRLIG